MAEKKEKRGARPSAAELFAIANKKKHPRLFLAKYLTEEADRLMVGEAEMERVAVVLKKWADAAIAGHLDKKETSLDGDFLAIIFGEALGYKTSTDSPNDFHREKNPTIPGARASPTERSDFLRRINLSPRPPSSS